jgi:hypothetical protein
VVSLAVVLIADPAEQATGGTASPLSASVQLLLAVLFFFLAYRNWSKRPKRGEQAEMPKWMSGIDSMTPGKALGPGVALSGVNPKISPAVSAGVAIASAGLNSDADDRGPGHLHVLGASRCRARHRQSRPGRQGRAHAQQPEGLADPNNAAVMMVLFVVFGFVMLGKGLGPLIGG